MPSSQKNQIITIPDTLRDWPWKRSVNPYYLQCKTESSEWLESFQAFDDKAQDAFNRCDFNLLASMAFARLDKAGCRVGCDLMNVFFVIDEYSDVATAAEARVQADVVMDALRKPLAPRPAGEWIGGEITRQFWENAIKTATESAQKRFIHMFQLYTDSVVQQAEDRDTKRIRDIDSYFQVRRETIGAKPSFAINEIHLALPDNVLKDPIIQSLTDSCVDMLIIGNDLCSYNVEQSREDASHNLVTIVMEEKGLGLQSACDWIGQLHDRLVARFLADFAKIPNIDYGRLNTDIAEYVDGLGNWVRANDQWSFESQRYFGTNGLTVLQSRKVELLPPSRTQYVNKKTSKFSDIIRISNARKAFFPVCLFLLCLLVNYLVIGYVQDI